MRYWLVMPAAGAGRRFGATLPKQYAALAGRTVIEWALDPFLRDARCRGVVLALCPDDPHWDALAARLAAPPAGPLAGTPAGSPAGTPPRPAAPAGRGATAGPGTPRVTPGGAERCESVRNALAALATEARPADWVLVHDAARPCLERADLDALLAALASHPVGGLLAAPCTDTMKRADASQSVLETVPREAMWRALTPQMFRYGPLCAALDRARAAGRTPTDEAQALEWAGEAARLVPGAASNLKITTAEDLVVAELMLARRAIAPGDRAGPPTVDREGAVHGD